MATAECKIMVTNETGLHARPASVFVEEAGSYDSTVKVIKDEQEVNAKSIMGIMSLGVEEGTEIIIEAEGDDAQEAVDALVELVQDDFGE